MRGFSSGVHFNIIAITFLLTFGVWYFVDIGTGKSLLATLRRHATVVAACDTSFFTVPTNFQKGCVIPNSQIYAGDTRYVFFNPASIFSNAAYVQTSNAGLKDQTANDWAITVSRPTSVYILTRHIPGLTQAPNWITSSYSRQTTDDLSNINQFFLRKNDQGLIGLYDIWKQDYETGSSPLFHAASENSFNAYSMYIVAIVPRGGGIQTTNPGVGTPRPSATDPGGQPTPPSGGGPIAATVETQPVPHSGDAADDPAIWVNKSNPGQSAVVGTDKLGGLAVYDMAGKQVQYVADGEMNNVDLREGFPLGGQQVVLVTAGNRSNNTIAIYKLDPSTRQLTNVAARAITTTSVYGSTMYHDTSANKFYYYINSKSGAIQQWELFDNGAGKVDAKLVRSLKVPSQPEGCVADDELGFFYIGEEAKGIWKFSASATGSTTGSIIAPVGQSGLTSNVEGLALVKTGNGTGYLLASSQGSNSYNVYRREGNNAFVKNFKIIDGNGIDGTSQTDGIDATNQNMGSSFPNGMFVAQDGSNTGGNQNFKYVPWQLLGL